MNAILYFCTALSCFTYKAPAGDILGCEHLAQQEAARLVGIHPDWVLRGITCTTVPTDSSNLGEPI